MAFETISLGTQPAGTGGDTARTAFEKVNRNFIAADVLAAAMSQAQFDANRNANKELYAASGWVSFGNHESGKQVNECKSGLYTALTMPNTLLIGKAGGVGGSKTDYASVHIDGVIFNLTNQFVLTLPSHATSVFPQRMDMYGVESEKVEISLASPNAYQGGLRGVGTAVNLFSATDQQKKDFFAQNSNTTYIGTDGKIYQWQLYRVSFAGTTDGIPSPTEQGYSLNSFGDLWLKSGKNLLYFGNALRLNDGGYHPSFNPLGAAKFVGDTFWHNTATSITSRADCFNPAKLLADSGSIASGKSGRPEIGGRYYDAIYAEGYGGVCRDMRYTANGIVDIDFYYEYQIVNVDGCRGFENVLMSKFFSSITQNCVNGIMLNKDSDIVGWVSGYIANNSQIGLHGNVIHEGAYVWVIKSGVIVSKGIFTGGQTKHSDGNWYATIYFDKDYVPTGSISGGSDAYLIICHLSSYSVGGSFLQTDLIANPANILSTPALASGLQGGWVPVLPTGTSKTFSRNRKALGVNFRFYSVNNGTSWGIAGQEGVGATNNIADGAISAIEINISQYQVFAKQTESAPNAAIYSLVPCKVFASSDYQPANGALLGESLIGKVVKNNLGVSVNNKSLLSCAIDGTGKLTSAASFDGVTHSPLTLGSPANNSPAFKVVSYLANINQQAVPHFSYTELKHNGTNWGDDGKVTIVDNLSTKTDLNGNTVLVGTAKLKEPIGWIKNKV